MKLITSKLNINKIVLSMYVSFFFVFKRMLSAVKISLEMCVLLPRWYY